MPRGSLVQRPDDSPECAHNGLVDLLRREAGAGGRHAMNDDVLLERAYGEGIAGRRAGWRRRRCCPHVSGSSRRARHGQAGHACQRGEGYRYGGQSGDTHHAILADRGSKITRMAWVCGCCRLTSTSRGSLALPRNPTGVQSRAD